MWAIQLITVAVAWDASPAAIEALDDQGLALIAELDDGQGRGLGDYEPDTSDNLPHLPGSTPLPPVADYQSRPLEEWVSAPVLDAQGRPTGQVKTWLRRWYRWDREMPFDPDEEFDFDDDEMEFPPMPVLTRQNAYVPPASTVYDLASVVMDIRNNREFVNEVIITEDETPAAAQARGRQYIVSLIIDPLALMKPLLHTLAGGEDLQRNMYGQAQLNVDHRQIRAAVELERLMQLPFRYRYEEPASEVVSRELDDHLLPELAGLVFDFVDPHATLKQLAADVQDPGPAGQELRAELARSYGRCRDLTHLNPTYEEARPRRLRQESVALLESVRRFEVMLLEVHSAIAGRRAATALVRDPPADGATGRHSWAHEVRAGALGRREGREARQAHAGSPASLPARRATH